MIVWIFFKAISISNGALNAGHQFLYNPHLLPPPLHSTPSLHRTQLSQPAMSCRLAVSATGGAVHTIRPPTHVASRTLLACRPVNTLRNANENRKDTGAQTLPPSKPTHRQAWRCRAAAKDLDEDVIDVEGREIDDRIPVTVSSRQPSHWAPQSARSLNSPPRCRRAPLVAGSHRIFGQWKNDPAQPHPHRRPRPPHRRH